MDDLPTCSDVCLLLYMTLLFDSLPPKQDLTLQHNIAGTGMMLTRDVCSQAIWISFRPDSDEPRNGGVHGRYCVSTRHMVPFLYCRRSTLLEIGELGFSRKNMFAPALG